MQLFNHLLVWYREALTVLTSFFNQEVFEKEQSICSAEEQPAEEGVSWEQMFLMLAEENFWVTKFALLKHLLQKHLLSVSWTLLSKFGSQL